MEPYLTAVIGIISAVGGAGGAWGAATQRIKHAEREIVDMRSSLTEHERSTRLMGERLARIEGKLDLIVTRISRG